MLVEVNCETDFVARTDDFQTLLKELALQVAAASPQYVAREDVPADVLERERAIYRAQMENSGKPPQVIEKIVEGKLGSFYEQVVPGRPAVDSRPEDHRHASCCRPPSPSSARTSASRASCGSRSANLTQ